MNVNQQDQTIGQLECTVVDALPEGAKPTRIAVICHGYGAPGTDLVPIGAELLQYSEKLKEHVRFYFPKAPIVLGGFGPFESRAWWHIDIEQLERAMAGGETVDRSLDIPEGMPEARAMIDELIQHVAQESGVPLSHFIFGGFSQGSMLTTDVVLHLDENPALLLSYSGTLLCKKEWGELAQKRHGVKVFQSHGRQDPLLPFAAAENLRDLLSDAGLNVEFLPFDGPHTIPPAALRRTIEVLDQVCAAG